MRKERIWNKDFTIVTLAHSIMSIGMYMITPTFPLFLVSIGATESQVGVVVTLFYVSSILTRFLINGVLARLGKKRVFVAGVALNIIAMTCYGLTKSIYVAAALHVIQGMGLGAFAVTAATLAVDALPDSRRGEGIGYFTMGVVIAMAIAPAIALFIRSNFGFKTVFIIAAITNLISMITVLFVKEIPFVKPAAQEKVKTFEWRNLYDKRLILASFFVLLFGICRSVDLNYITLFAEAKGLSHLSWFFVVQTAAMFVIRLFMGRVYDKRGRNWVILPGGIAMLATMLTLAMTNSSGLLLLGACFSGLTSGILAPNLQLWLLNSVNAEKRSVASASYFSFVEIGSALAAPIMGLLAQNVGYSSMFWTGSCVAVVYIIGYLTFGKEKRAARLSDVK